MKYGASSKTFQCLINMLMVVYLGSFPFSNLNILGTDVLVKEFRRHSVIEYNRLITESRRGNSCPCEKDLSVTTSSLNACDEFVRRRKYVYRSVFIYCVCIFFKYVLVCMCIYIYI